MEVVLRIVELLCVKSEGGGGLISLYFEKLSEKKTICVQNIVQKWSFVFLICFMACGGLEFVDVHTGSGILAVGQAKLVESSKLAVSSVNSCPLTHPFFPEPTFIYTSDVHPHNRPI